MDIRISHDKVLSTYIKHVDRKHISAHSVLVGRSKFLGLRIESRLLAGNNMYWDSQMYFYMTARIILARHERRSDRGELLSVSWYNI